MADFTAVGLGAQTPDMFGKLSQLLTIKSQQQGLAGQAAQVQQEEQTTRQRASLAKHDFSQYMGEDGTIDLNRMVNSPALLADAGDQFLDIVSKGAAFKQQQLEAKSKLVGLRHDQREEFAAVMGGLSSDPDVAEDTEKGRQKVNEALVQYGEMYGEDVLDTLGTYATQLRNVPPGKMPSALKSIQMQAASASEQLEKQRPTYANTGATLVDVNPYSPKGQSAKNIPVEIPPGFELMTDPRTGNPYLINKQSGVVRDVGQGFPGREPSPTAPPNTPTGGPAPSVSPNASPTASTRPPSMPAPFYPGQERDIQTQQAAVDSTRSAADRAPVNRDMNSEVLKLSQNTATGPGTAFWRDSKFGGMFGDDYQTLGKYLQKTAIEGMQAMGGSGSDARLDAAAAANGSTKFNPGALQAVTKFNDATNSALEKFREGMDKAVGTTNPNYSALPDFRAQWAKNFDVDVYRYENAVRDGDTKELEKLAKDMKANPERAKELQRKAANLRSLSTTGRLP